MFLVENVIGFFLDNGRLIWIIIVEINIVIERVNYMMWCIIKECFFCDVILFL